MKDQAIAGKLLTKKLEMSKSEIVEFQIMIYCFLNNLRLNHTEIKLLALLGELGKIKLADFGQKAVNRKLLSSIQAVNTALHKLHRTGLYVKEGIGKKVIYLEPRLGVLSDGNIVINLLLVKLDAKKTTGAVSANSRKAAVTA